MDVYDQVLAEVRSIGEGIKCLYCRCKPQYWKSCKPAHSVGLDATYKETFIILQRKLPLSLHKQWRVINFDANLCGIVSSIIGSTQLLYSGGGFSSHNVT